MRTDGNLVLYALGKPGGYKLPLRSSGTYGNPGAYATMQQDGNFVVYRSGGGPRSGGGIWHTGTYGTLKGRVAKAPRPFRLRVGCLPITGRIARGAARSDGDALPPWPGVVWIRAAGTGLESARRTGRAGARTLGP